MGNRRIWNPLILLATGTVMGAGAAFSSVPAITRLPEAWVGFFGSIAGGLVGGLLGVVAGWLAWAGVQDQIAQGQAIARHKQERAMAAIADHAGRIRSFWRRAREQWLQANGQTDFEDCRRHLIRSHNSHCKIFADDVELLMYDAPLDVIRSTRKLFYEDHEMIDFTKRTTHPSRIPELKEMSIALDGDAEFLLRLIREHLSDAV